MILVMLKVENGLSVLRLKCLGTLSAPEEDKAKCVKDGVT
jgi:hypothetical protein